MRQHGEFINSTSVSLINKMGILRIGRGFPQYVDQASSSEAERLLPNDEKKIQHTST